MNNFNIVIEDLSPFDERKLVNCIQESFPAPEGEVMARVLNITREDYLSYSELVCEKAVKDRLTVVARDLRSDEIVGFCINEDFVTAPKYSEMHVSSKFNPLFAILEEMDENFQKIRTPKENQIFHAYMMGIDKRYQGQNLSGRLIMATLEKARSENFQSVLAEATGVISQKVVLNMGFKEIDRRIYRDFQYKATFPFFDITKPEACLLVERKFGGAGE